MKQPGKKWDIYLEVMLTYGKCREKHALLQDYEFQEYWETCALRPGARGTADADPRLPAACALPAAGAKPALPCEPLAKNN